MDPTPLVSRVEMPRARNDHVEKKRATRRLRHRDWFVGKRRRRNGARRRDRCHHGVGDGALGEQNLLDRIGTVVDVGSVRNAGGEGYREEAREDRAMNKAQDQNLAS